MPMRSPRPESWGRLTPYYPWPGNQGWLDRLQKNSFSEGYGLQPVKGAGFSPYVLMENRSGFRSR
jgi:hypothetical protein